MSEPEARFRKEPPQVGLFASGDGRKKFQHSIVERWKEIAK